MILGGLSSVMEPAVRSVASRGSVGSSAGRAQLKSMSRKEVGGNRRHDGGREGKCTRCTRIQGLQWLKFKRQRGRRAAELSFVTAALLVHALHLHVLAAMRQ